MKAEINKLRKKNAEMIDTSRTGSLEKKDVWWDVFSMSGEKKELAKTQPQTQRMTKDMISDRKGKKVYKYTLFTVLWNDKWRLYS